MTQREFEICERVNIARKEIIKWSQPDLAQGLGITQNQLAGIEYKRAPLRLRHAKFICERFNISQRWLALGVLPAQPQYDIEMEYSYLVKPNTLFSWVFDNYWKEQTLRIETEWVHQFGEANFRNGQFEGMAVSVFQPLAKAFAHATAHNVRQVIGITYNLLPEDLQPAYSDALTKAHESFQTKYAKQISHIPPTAQRKFWNSHDQIEEPSLTNVTKSGNNQGVKAKLPTLLKRLNEATHERGAKTELAKIMGVPLSKVSQWLSGTHEPSGETTLQLLNWVEQQERQ